MIDVTFEKTPIEQLLEAIASGDEISIQEYLEQMGELSEEDAAKVRCALEKRYDLIDHTDTPRYEQDKKTVQRLKLEEKLVKEGQLMTGLDENDPLRLFLEEVAAMPSPGDEKQLVAQYTPGDEDTAQKLAYLSLDRVVERACTMVGHGVLLFDLIQEGCLGLWMGIIHYTGGDYEAHVCQWIERYLKAATLQQAYTDNVIYKVEQGAADYRDADQRLLSELGRNPTVEEIAEAIHVTVEEAAAIAAILTQARLRQKIDQSRLPREQTPEDRQAVEDTAFFQTRQKILELLSTLTEQEGRLLVLRFGLEGGQPKTPQQVGEALGLTAEEAVKMETAVLRKLRRQLRKGE